MRVKQYIRKLAGLSKGMLYLNEGKLSDLNMIIFQLVNPYSGVCVTTASALQLLSRPALMIR